MAFVVSVRRFMRDCLASCRLFLTWWGSLFSQYSSLVPFSWRMKAAGPSLRSHQRPLGLLAAPLLLPLGPTAFEPVMSILLRHPLPKDPRLRPPSMERPSTSRTEGRIPAIAQVVGIRSVWLTRAAFVAFLTPGPLTKNGTSEDSQ